MLLVLLCCLTGDKKVDRDSDRDDKKVNLLTRDKKVSKKKVLADRASFCLFMLKNSANRAIQLAKFVWTRG